MMMKNMKKLSLAVVALSAAAIFSSCEKEVSPSFGDGKYVTFKVSTSNIQTKASSAEVLETVDFSNQGVELFLTGVKTLNTSDPFGPSTKAGNPIKKEDVDQFNIRMTNPSGEDHIDGMAILNKGSEYWSMVYDGSTTPVEWFEDAGNTSFLAYYPYTASNTLFSNTLKNTVEYSTENAQEDFIVAYAAYDHSQSHDEYHTPVPYVELNFKHALAQIVFSIADNAVSKVVIRNAVIGADLEYDVENEEFTSSEAKLGDVESAVVDGTCSFFVAPTALGEGSKLILEFQMADGTVLRTVNLGTDSWDAGWTYSYKLSSAPEYDVEVEITDNSNVTVSNVSAPAVYIRAAIVANIFDGPKIITNPSEVKINISGSWAIGEDGYYYYKKPVLGFQSAEQLIDSIEGLENNAKIFSAVQAILYTGKDALSVWGDKVPDALIEELN